MLMYVPLERELKGVPRGAPVVWENVTGAEELTVGQRQGSGGRYHLQENDWYQHPMRDCPLGHLCSRGGTHPSQLLRETPALGTRFWSL